MIKIDLYIRVPEEYLKELFSEQSLVDSFYIENADKCFIHIDDQKKIQSILEPNAYSIHPALIISYNEKQISDFRFVDLELLTQFIAICQDYYLSDNKEAEDTTSRISIQLKKVSSNTISLKAVRSRLYYGDTDEIIIDTELPEQQFIEALFVACKEFYGKLIEYGISINRHEKTLLRLEPYEKSFQEAYK
ncbi:hypothetical protein EN829_035270 [Mesorhizobium sp. M00.F.Ca.ET.186.01.1.1]|nr:hypothetical protein EN829_035270 [Mesorhizobium sp. M00.F.Ca.ET.186.01.1.1]